MYVVRNVFQAKPGKAKELANIFKAALPIIKKEGAISGGRILTDAAAGFWNVVIEADVEDMGKYFDQLNNMGSNAELREKMKGYMDLTTGGHREIWKVE